MAERISAYVSEGSMMKLHDVHKLISTGIPGGLSQSKAVEYCIIYTWNQAFGGLGNPNNWSDEERAVVAKYASAAPDGDPGVHFMLAPVAAQRAPAALDDEEDER